MKLAAFLVVVLSVCVLLVQELISLQYTTDEPSGEYDFIVVGGGTAGCLIAASLAQLNSTWTVLLLEAGAGTRSLPISEQSVPGGAADNVAFEHVDWKYRVEQQTAPLKGTSPGGFRGRGRSYPIPRGKGLGGSNELNVAKDSTCATWTASWCASPSQSRVGPRRFLPLSTVC